MKCKALYILSSIFAIVTIVISCANPGTPTGGPKDRKPPVLVRSIPEPNSIGFKGNMVTLVFDENIQLKDQDTKFVMSPPLATAPKLDAHGNMLRIRFESDTCLMPGTTYTLDFADCVSDLNENNILENFTFTFSTGESQDSMMISGNLYNAATIEPMNGIYVLLQSNLSDTAFNKAAPIRIAKTDKEGRFAIKNVPADRSYRIYALDDQNKNFKYDMPGAELIAWHDSIHRPGWEIRQINDSIKIDSLSMSADTAEWVFEHVVRDTLVYTPDSLTLFAFTEDTYDQYITSDERKKKNTLNVVFNNRMKEKPRFSFPGQPNEENKGNEHAVVQYSTYNDTVCVWLTDSTLIKGDSVVMAISYPVLDSLKEMTEHIDTLQFWYFDKPQAKEKEKPSSRRKRDKEKEKKPTVPTLKISVPNSAPVYAPFSLVSQTPYGLINWDGIRLEHKVDTIFEPMKYTSIVDTIDICRVAIRAMLEPGEEYKLTIDSASVRDIYGLQCDKIETRVAATKLDKYGTLYIVVKDAPENSLLQLVNAKGEMIRQNYVPGNGKVAFKYLKPQEYMIRIVCDDNRNGKWDKGNYEEKKQPEKIVYYMERVTVRANWDIKVDFDTKLYSPDKFVKKFYMKKSRGVSNKPRK